jgi:hypothetical protein
MTPRAVRMGRASHHPHEATATDEQYGARLPGDPYPPFQDFAGRLDGERMSSQYSYGFPNGDGDCNCITWLERLGLPLLTGRINEFLGVLQIVSCPRRRFGACV